MQRQAVPLTKKEKAIVGTGLEKNIARSSDSTLLAKNSGIVKFKNHNKIIIEEKNHINFKNYINKYYFTKLKVKNKRKISKNEKYKRNVERTYNLDKTKKSNQNTITFQLPTVVKNQWIKKGQIISDGAGTYDGEITLGKNLLIGYIGWEGYNFEDAVVINKRLVEEDILSSVHIKKYKTFLVNDFIEEVRTMILSLKKKS